MFYITGNLPRDEQLPKTAAGSGWEFPSLPLKYVGGYWRRPACVMKYPASPLGPRNTVTTVHVIIGETYRESDK